jgi:hypothetical protein
VSGLVDDWPVPPSALLVPAGPAGIPPAMPLLLLTAREARRLLLAQSRMPTAMPPSWTDRVAPAVVPWETVWKWSRATAHRSRTQSDTLWLALHNALSTGHRNRWRPGVDGSCPHGCRQVEDAVHLLLDCGVAAGVWGHALARWRELSGLDWRVSALLVVTGKPGSEVRPAGKPVPWPQWYKIHGAVVQALWHGRCKVALGGSARVSVEEVWAMAQAYVRRQEEELPGEGGEGPDLEPVQ